jgi:hypothetical protein
MKLFPHRNSDYMNAPVFCFVTDVRINSKIYLNVFELILKYIQNLSSSLSKSSRRLRTLPKVSPLELNFVHPETAVLVKKGLLHQILYIIKIHTRG